MGCSKTSSALALVFFVHALCPLCSSSSSTIPHPNEDVAVALGALEVDDWEVAYTHLSRARKESESAPGPFWTTQLHKLLGVSAYKSGRETEGEKFLVEACNLDPEMCAEVNPAPIPTTTETQLHHRPHHHTRASSLNFPSSETMGIPEIGRGRVQSPESLGGRRRCA
jgi:hypothetical protein